MHRQHRTGISWAVVAGITLAAATAFAQNNRIRNYHNELEKELSRELESFRTSLVEQRTEELEQARLRQRQQQWTTSGGQGHTTTAEAKDVEEKTKALARVNDPFAMVVNVGRSNDGDGQDVEIRLTMPLDTYMEFAPIAALEAAAVPHKFPVVYIYLREETTDRVARVAFRDAEPIAGRYLAGDEDAVDDMRDALIWH